MSVSRTRAITAEAAIERLAGAGLPPLKLLEQVAGRVRSVVPYAAAAWLLTDPATLLHTGAVNENVPGELQLRLIDNELAVADVAKFADIARRPRPAERLSAATAGALECSARYRSIYEPAGFGDELRVAFCTPGACWAVGCLGRAAGEPAFSAAEADFLARVASHVGRGLRAALRGTTVRDGAPATLVLASDDSVESLTDEARCWLADLPSDGLPLPGIVYELARSAHAGTAARARVPLETGHWLVMHAAPLRDADSHARRTAIMLQPTLGPDLASLLLTVHELTEREREIVELMIGGLATEEISSRLVISRHTLRDHVKAIFAKLGVRSRPELTAKLLRGA